MNVQPLALDTHQLSFVLSIGTKAADQLMTSGTIPTIEIAGSRRARVEDVQNYVANLPVATPS